MKRLLTLPILILSLFLGGVAIPTADAFDVNDPPAEVVATWEGAHHFLPGSATLSGTMEQVSFDQKGPMEPGKRIARDYLKPGVKIPAVIYLHNCSGSQHVNGWAEFFSEFGFAFFAPNSFLRPGRKIYCGRGISRTIDYRMKMRTREALYALHQVKKLPWIDQKRLILMGFSEGAFAASGFHYDGFIAHILLATACRFTHGFSKFSGSPLAPSGVAVLNIVGKEDRFYGRGCNIRRDNGGSKKIQLEYAGTDRSVGKGHIITSDHPEAVAAILKFLEACCGIAPPKNAGEGLDVSTEVMKLLKEFDSMATFFAQMRADDAASKGDGKGRQFWLNVLEELEKLRN